MRQCARHTSYQLILAQGSTQAEPSTVVPPNAKIVQGEPMHYPKHNPPPARMEQSIEQSRKLHATNDQKSFLSLLGQLCKPKVKPQPISVLVDELGKKYQDHLSIQNKLALILKEKNPSNPGPVQQPTPRPPTSLTFSEADIKNAIKDCNFSKGMGPDGFDGSIITALSDLEGKICRDICQYLNQYQLPYHILSGRYIPLSKSKTKQETTLDDVRPIIVKSHFLKIIEKIYSPN